MITRFPSTLKVSGIYKITNIVNNKCYIGSAVNIRDRFKNHLNALSKNKHCNNHLQGSWNKHGSENFNFELVEEVLDKTILFQREQFYIDTLRPEFNIREKADNRAGFKHKDSTKEKISKTLKGRPGNNKGRKFSEEWRNNLSISRIKQFENKENHPRFGKAKTEEEKRKISETLKGSISPFKGRVHSEETRQKMKKAWIKRKENALTKN